jgi:hypothetical protein
MRSIVAAATVFLALATVAMAADPFVGTWKLNVAKSRFNPGHAPKRETIIITALDNGLRHLTNGIDEEGKATHFNFTAYFDGKDYSVTGTVPVGLTMALEKIDAYTYEMVGKINGKEIQRRRNVISKDRKTLTRTVTGKNSQGQDINNVLVFDKQ